MKCRIIMACMIGLMTATAAFAADDSTNLPSAPPVAPRPPRPIVHGLLRQGVLDQLALTPEQKAKYDALNASFKSDLAKWRADNASDIDAPAGSGRQTMQQLHRNYIEKVKAFLTAEQNATLDKAMPHGPGPGGRGGPNGGPDAPPPPQSPPPPGNN